jgi:hypothetical protein
MFDLLGCCNCLGFSGVDKKSLSISYKPYSPKLHLCSAEC